MHDMNFISISQHSSFVFELGPAARFYFRRVIVPLEFCRCFFLFFFFSFITSIFILRLMKSTESYGGIPGVLRGSVVAGD